jgi:hypothetical protein
VSSLHIAVAESARAAAEAALQRLPPPRPVLVAPDLPAEARLRLRWQRLWQERRRAAGESEAEAEAALRDGSARALLAALDRQADAVLLSAADGRAGVAWSLLEPRPSQAAVADLWIAELPPTGAPAGAPAVVGWCDWPAAGAAAAAHALRTAAAEIERLAAAPARPLALDFFGGREDKPARAAALAEVLAARGPAAGLRLYSPLLFSDGRLDALALAGRLRAAAGALPVIAAPRLAREEFAAAVERAGGSWAGPLRAGAEVPAALAPAAPAPARLAATLRWLAPRRG